MDIILLAIFRVLFYGCRMDIKTYRKKHKITQQGLADLLGIVVGSVRRYEKGRIPEREIVEKLYIISGGEITPNGIYGIGNATDLKSRRRG